MRTGVATSVVAHSALLILAIVGLGSAKPLEPTVVESIAVDLVPITDVTNIRAGSLDSKVVETETPAIVETETPAEIAQPTGNTEEDQVTPEETDKATPAPVQNTAPQPEAAPVEPTPEATPPEPSPEPTPQPAEEPKPTPEPVAAEADPAPEQAAEEAPVSVAEAADTALAKAAAPMPAMRPAALQKAPEPKKVAEAKPEQVTPKKETPKKESAPKTETTKAQPDPQAKEADEVAALINSENSRGATSGAGGSPTLGKNSGRTSTLSQNEMAALSAAMKACFSPPPGAIEENATALVEVRLDPSGMVVGSPAVLSVTGPATGTLTGKAAVRAVQRCGQNGYTMLPPDKYDGDAGWNTVKVTFNANDRG